MKNLPMIKLKRMLLTVLVGSSMGNSYLLEIRAAAPPVREFPGIQADATGRALQSSMIWAGPEAPGEGVAVTFRKTFALTNPPNTATLSIFADARYILWVNGQYVERGPARFQPNGPEYDPIDIASHLQAGSNVLALVVVGNLSGGKVMRHVPGLTAILDCDGREVLRTDASWQCTLKNPYQKVRATWADLLDERVDARIPNGDWTAVEYDASQWQMAKHIDGSAWGPLTARRIPRLRETPVPFQIQNGATLPMTLTNGQRLRFTTSRLVQAYPVISFTADAGTEMAINPCKVNYVAQAGPQTYFTLDTMGTTQVEIVVKQGRASITGFKLMERLYPYNRLGNFTCNDPFLNQLWEMCARSCEVLSEDSYVDCADRERVEWMDDTPPGFDITETAMAGPAAADGKIVFSDPRLLEELVRRTGLTLQPEGWVKAHTCSDRYDIHAQMEDRACDWVAGLRLYYEATGDPKVIQEIWPAVVAQMNYFLDRRTPRGLVRGRDWVVWGNPLGYLTGETTTLNVFVQRALADSAFLAGAIGAKEDGQRFSDAADHLKQAINTVLWDEADGGFCSGYFDEVDATNLNRTVYGLRKVALPVTDHRTPATLHADLFALDQGVVPPERRDRVISAMLKQTPDQLSGSIMVYYYAMKQMYALDRPEFDTRVLNMFRQGWKAMVANPWDCSWEGFDGGSKAHIYGMYPGYFLSADVLGVRRDAPVWKHQIVIAPHLGGLTHAGGVVVTPFGPVPVDWNNADGVLHFKVTVPENTAAWLELPSKSGRGEINLNGKSRRGTVQGSRLVVTLKPGVYLGDY
jgi:hypothetical protein